MNIPLKVVGAYVAGVVTAPAWIYAFRDKLAPLAFEIIADEQLDKNLQEMMLMRNDFQDIREKHGEKAKQLQAQGYSKDAIGKELGLNKRQVRWALSPKTDEGTGLFGKRKS